MAAAFQKLREERDMTEGGVREGEGQCGAGVGQEVDGMDLNDKGPPEGFNWGAISPLLGNITPCDCHKVG